MKNQEEILRSLEDLKNRAHELKTPEEIAKFIAGMPIAMDLRIHLYSNLAEAGFISAPLAATGWSGFSPRKAIKWVIKEVKNDLEEKE